MALIICRVKTYSDAKTLFTICYEIKNLFGFDVVTTR